MGVATTEFIDAAEIQGKNLGFDPAMIFVQHPIQDRTNAEIEALADAALNAIIAKVEMSA